jgi:glycosyltransferase involved in cell wall biosynthesis
MISIIIPLYNKQNYIRATIESVLNQTFDKFELIIINDGSTDDSLKIVNSILDDRIKVISIENGGVSNARNTGIKNANYEWIAFLDGDDYWAPQYLFDAFNEINNNPTIQVIATNYYKVYNERKIKGLNISTGFINSYFDKPCIHSSAIIINKKILDLAGFFHEKLKYGEDQHLWFRIANYTKIFFQSYPLVYYRMDDHKLSNESVCNRDFSNDIVSLINELNITASGWEKFRSQYLFRYLRPYYICDNHLNSVRRLINEIPIKQKISVLYLFYLFPRFIIKPLYKSFYTMKYT